MQILLISHSEMHQQQQKKIVLLTRRESKSYF